MSEKRTILIAGPTASGKSAAALALAQRIGGEIVNADALAVYRDLDVLSARPGAAELARAPHHLFGHVDGAARYSVGEWSRAAAAALADIHARGAVAIFAGGTGLYFRAVERGLSRMPDIPAPIRAEAARRYDEIGAEAFRAEVLSLDPDMAHLRPADRQRHLRAWEVFRSSGVPLSSLRKETGPPIADRIDARVVIEPRRAALYAAADARFDRMLGEGAVEEARALLRRGLEGSLPVMKAVGAAELVRYLSGDLPLDRAVALAKQSTRRLAKRQLTWFRHQAASWPRATTPDDAVEALCAALVAR